MLSKTQVQFISSLKTNKYRKTHRKFIAEGPKIVDELLRSTSRDIVVDKVLALKPWLEENLKLVSDDIELLEITERELKKISTLKTPNQVIAIVNIPEQKKIPDISFGLTLMLDEIKDPGNMGTIIRTADWFGIKNIICSNNCVDVFNPKVVQSTMGSLIRLNILYTSLENYLDEVSGKMKVYGTLMDGKNIYETDLDNSAVIIIGNESNGISNNLKRFITNKISVPAFPDKAKRSAESLNASVATAIVCAEFRRQYK